MRAYPFQSARSVPRLCLPSVQPDHARNSPSRRSRHQRAPGISRRHPHPVPRHSARSSITKSTSRRNFAHTPGLRVTSPATPNARLPHDPTGNSIERPCHFLEPKSLLAEGMSTSTPRHQRMSRVVVRTGTDVTVVGHGAHGRLRRPMQRRSPKAREISLEVIDLRSLSPVSAHRRIGRENWTTERWRRKRRGMCSSDLRSRPPSPTHSISCSPPCCASVDLMFRSCQQTSRESFFQTLTILTPSIEREGTDRGCS